MMKLYSDPRAPNPRRVRMVLAEKGVPYENVVVDIGAKENLAPAYRSKNPLGLLPVLELDDGRLLRESMAISRYLEELYPEPSLFGRDSWERALVEQWSRHAELEILFNVAMTFQHTSPFWVGRRTQVPEFGEVAKRTLLERLAWFDQELEGRTFLVGEAPTVADITLFVAVDFARVVKVRVDDATPNLLRHFRTMGDRPSAKV